MKIYFKILTGFLLFTSLSFGATTPIDQSLYTNISVSSDNPNHPGADAVDGDNTTFWALWSANPYSLPGEMELQFSDGVHNLDGFSYLPNPNNLNGRALGYKVFVSTDGLDWGSPEVQGSFEWTSDSDAAIKTISFGAVEAEYVKVVFETSVGGIQNIHTSELVLFEDSSSPTTKENQLITNTSISDKFINDSSFLPSAVASSGLDLTYSIVSGPATIVNNEIDLDGTEGDITVKIEQVGNNDYYPVEVYEHFSVIDLSVYDPVITTRLTDDLPLEMSHGLHAYPIYIYTEIGYSQENSITSVVVTVNGVEVEVEMHDNYYSAIWTPDSYGDHVIDIVATGSNGNATTLTKNISVVNEAADQTANAFSDIVIEFQGVNNRTYKGLHTLPQHLNSYTQLMGKLIVECPDGDCDDWDRKASIDVRGPNGNWIQIIRYMTPYGVGCNHQIDLTDYQSLLQGDVEFRVFIDTWGTGGWQLTLDLEMTAGEPEFVYSSVHEIWDANYDFGNPSNLQPVDTVFYNYPDGVLSSHMRLSTTGHGWGETNSQNAAEFYEATNFIDVDNVEIYEQNLWENCNPNSDNCTGQMGTWMYSRAGWCPGTIAQGDIVNLNSVISNNELQFTYKFDPTYTDFCHPNNPDCVTGVTCSDCDDTYKAIYFVDAQIINYSNSPALLGVDELDYVDNDKVYQIDVFPNPTNNVFRVKTLFDGPANVYIQSVSGAVVGVYQFDDSDAMSKFEFNIASLKAGIYFLSIENNGGTGVKKIVKK